MTVDEINTLTTQFSRALPKPADFLDVSDAADERKYVPDLQGQGDTVGRLKKSIDVAIGESIFLFSGQPGSGKSTELKRLKKLISTPDRKVYYIDLEHWISLEDIITLPNLLLAIVAALLTELRMEESKKAGYFTRLMEFANRGQAELTEITLPKELGGFKFTIKNNASFRALLDEKLKGRVNEFVAEAHNVIKSIKDQLCNDDQELVLIVDSLEKIRGTQANRSTVYEKLENIFTNDVYALRFPECKMVYSVSPVLVDDSHQLLANLGMGVIVRMPSVHVFKDQDHSRELDEQSVAKMADLVTKLFPNWQQVFTQEQMRDLIAMSGGDLRDFYRAIRIALTEDTDTLPLPDSAIVYTKNQLRPPKDNLPIEHIQWLKKVDANHQTNLSKDFPASVLQSYLISKHVLLYMNGSSWYAVHPLLQDWLAQQAAAT